MSIYPLLRQGLFRLDGERAHRLTLTALSRGSYWFRQAYGARVPAVPVEIMGLRLPNPIGLAAGLDKDGACIDGLAALGFGFIEIGTVTPRAQAGNPRPRLFRLVKEGALINRLGFNNAGIDALAARVRAARFRGVLGINIGKNRDTPAENAVDDYIDGLRRVAGLASYVTINISSPNTRGLRDLQARDSLDALLARLVAERDALATIHGRRVPLAVKIAPDLDTTALDTIAERLLYHRIDAVIATNTTIDRAGIPARWQDEAGGLSGRPLRERSTAVIAALHKRLGDRLPIIGVGGIQSADDARAKLEAGARALQIYSGLIYRGPTLIRDCAAVAAERATRGR